MPGLGHLYLGRFRQGILWIGAAVALMTSAIVALLVSPTSGGLTLALAFIGLGIALTLTWIVRVWCLARRNQTERSPTPA